MQTYEINLWLDKKIIENDKLGMEASGHAKKLSYPKEMTPM